MLGAIVVEQPRDPPLAAVGKVPQQHRGRDAGAEHQHRHRVRVTHHGEEPPLLPGAVGKAAAAHRRDEQERRDQVRRARHRRADAEEGQRRGDRQRAEPDGNHDPLQVRQAREAPQAAVQARGEERCGIDGDHPGKARERHIQVFRRDLEVEAQPERREPRQPRGDEVVRERKEPPGVHGAPPRACRAQRTSTHAAIATSTAVASASVAVWTHTVSCLA